MVASNVLKNVSVVDNEEQDITLEDAAQIVEVRNLSVVQHKYANLILIIFMKNKVRFTNIIDMQIYNYSIVFTVLVFNIQSINRIYIFLIF